jgi:hypothetical protein
MLGAFQKKIIRLGKKFCCERDRSGWQESNHSGVAWILSIEDEQIEDIFDDGTLRFPPKFLCFGEHEVSSDEQFAK